jgi:hypothetical protein
VVALQEVFKEEQSAIRVAVFVGCAAPPASSAVSDGGPNERASFLKSKAVSVASAIKYGSVTAAMLGSFLQEDILGINGEYPLPDTYEIDADEGLADLLKTGSALALIKAMGYLMDEDPMPAGDAVDEYLDLRCRAEQANLGSAIIGLPKEGMVIDEYARYLTCELTGMVIDEYARYLTCELTGMVTLHSIEDPIERHRALLRLIRNQRPQRVTAEGIIREQRDRC